MKNQISALVSYHRNQVDNAVNGGHDLDLVTCDSFKNYLWWLGHASTGCRGCDLHRDAVSSLKHSGLPTRYRESDAAEGTRFVETVYWRVSDLLRVARDLPGLEQYAGERKMESSSFLNDWAFHYLQKDTVGVFSEFDNFHKLWSASRFTRGYRRGQFFLELIFSYQYSRKNLGSPSFKGVGSTH